MNECDLSLGAKNWSPTSSCKRSAVDPIICNTIPFSFKHADQPAGNIKLKEEEQTQEKKTRQQQIICRFCGNGITSTRFKLEINNRHIHTFFNQHGIVFELGCFTTASGCQNHGAPTYDFTWFHGYAWSFSSCRYCGEHLGWFYQSIEGNTFYGLILNKLREVD